MYIAVAISGERRYGTRTSGVHDDCRRCRHMPASLEMACRTYVGHGPGPARSSNTISSNSFNVDGSVSGRVSGQRADVVLSLHEQIT